MADDEVKDVGGRWKEGKKVRATRWEVRGFDLRDASNAVDKGTDMTDHAIMTYPTKIFETRTG